MHCLGPKRRRGERNTTVVHAGEVTAHSTQAERGGFPLFTNAPPPKKWTLMRDARIRDCTKQKQLTVLCSVPAHAAHAATPSCQFHRHSRTQHGRMCHQGEPQSQVAMPPLRHNLGVPAPACNAQSAAVKTLLPGLPQTHSTLTHRWEASAAGTPCRKDTPRCLLTHKCVVLPQTRPTVQSHVMLIMTTTSVPSLT